MSARPRTMRAAWYDRTGPARAVMTVGEMPVPDPAVGEVLVAVAASGVNPHDTKHRAGWRGLGAGQGRKIPHSDGAGTIVAVGPGVDGARIGQRVWVYNAHEGSPGQGMAADFAVVPAANAVPLPDGVPTEIGACLGVPGCTAHYAVFADGPVTGRTVLVTGGAGAVAQYAIEFARWDGATVIATVSGAEKAAVATAAGAAHTIDYRREDVVARVMAITGGGGVDRVVEVDFGENLATTVEVVKQNGTIAAYSATRVPEPVLPYYAFARKGLRLHFVQGLILTPPAREAAVRDIGAGLRAGVFRNMVAGRHPLADVAGAHERLETGTVGKVIVENGAG
ncbi:MAG: NADPH:quinone reductase [Rhodospirillales bacterium]|jgi:NADPH2:quinone reductase